MPRYRRPPATLADVWRDGPPVRVRDLIAITGLSPDTIRQDIVCGHLIASKRAGSSPYLVARDDARAWLTQMGFKPATTTLATVVPIGTSRNLSPTPYREIEQFLHAVVAMGLGSIVRNALATADKITGASDGLQCEIDHEAWTGMDGYGKPTYASAKTITALVSRRQVPIRTSSGETLTSRTQITIVQPLKANGTDGRTEPIDLRDRLTLPDGTTGKILDIQGFLDPSTGRPFGHEVFLG